MRLCRERSLYSTWLYLLLHTQAFFRNKNPISTCERRLKTMEQLCKKLPENDPMQKTLLETRDHVSEVKGEVESAHVRLQEHPDKWNEWNCRWGLERENVIRCLEIKLRCEIVVYLFCFRFGELSAWIASQHRDGESVAVQVSWYKLREKDGRSLQNS